MLCLHVVLGVWRVSVHRVCPNGLLESEKHEGWKTSLRSTSSTPTHPHRDSKSHPLVPHHYGSLTPPGTRTAPPPWAACVKHHCSFREVVLSNSKPEPALEEERDGDEKSLGVCHMLFTACGREVGACTQPSLCCCASSHQTMAVQENIVQPAHGRRWS